MKKKKITINIDSTVKYLRLWNGIFNLTDKELQILGYFIDVNLIRGEENVCSVPNKKDVAALANIKDHNTLNNYIKKFKDKGAMIKKETVYTINPFFDTDIDMVEVLIIRPDGI
tara:strand:+ start:760 stop:1101 length:342 start_codon:yes stop_codon:yes gene_type:complete